MRLEQGCDDPRVGAADLLVGVALEPEAEALAPPEDLQRGGVDRVGGGMRVRTYGAR